jgi:hypothetical protein
MKQDEIKAKSAELAAFYTAKANGRALQFNIPGVGFCDAHYRDAPDLASDLSRWRVKPEPRKCWLSPCGMIISGVTFDESVATRWSQQGMKVTEWVEVLP